MRDICRALFTRCTVRQTIPRVRANEHYFHVVEMETVVKMICVSCEEDGCQQRATQRGESFVARSGYPF